MTSRRISIILVTMMLAAACTGCDRSGARGRAAYDDPSLPSGAADFKHANSLIDRPTWGREKAFGNTEEAKKLALKFGEMLEAMQES